ncbi:MAG: DUF5693 family protein [Negativicutes bacterium]|jgi:hypothetical protein
MRRYNCNIALISVLVIGMLAAFFVAYQRNIAELGNNSVEIMMDYNDIMTIAQEDVLPLEVVAKQFKTIGVTSLAVYDVTLEELARQNAIALQSGEAMLAIAKSENNSPVIAAMEQRNLLNGGYTYIFDNHYSDYDNLKSDLTRRYGKNGVNEIVVNQQKIICVSANFDDIEKKPIAISAKQLRDVAKFGFFVVPRPFNYTRPTKADIEAVFNRLSVLPNYKYSGIMFAGDGVLGYRNLLDVTAAEMKKHGLPLYVCESPLQLQFMKQDGLAEMVRLNDYDAARAYVINKAEQPKLQLDVMVHRFQIAALERNVRIAFLRRIEKPLPDMNLLQTNLRYVNNVRNELTERDFLIGKAGLYPPYFPSNILLVLICLGVIAASTLLFANIFSVSKTMVLAIFVFGSLVVCIPVLRGGGTWARQLVAFLSAVTFPVLAGTWALYRFEIYPYQKNNWYRILLDGVGALAVISVAALIGGIFIGSVLGDIRFILEAEIFRGVKAAFILPPLLMAMVFISRYNLLENRINGSNDRILLQLKKLLDLPIYVKTMILVGIGMFIAWVLVGRSGDASGVPVPALEIKMRYFLENVMYARPREKEFLIGHPAFFVAFFAFWRKWPEWVKCILMMAVVVGLASSVETFCHLRSAIFLSTIRAFDGLLLGLIIGAVVFCVLFFGDKLFRWQKEHK